MWGLMRAASGMTPGMGDGGAEFRPQRVVSGPPPPKLVRCEQIRTITANLGQTAICGALAGADWRRQPLRGHRPNLRAG